MGWFECPDTWTEHTGIWVQHRRWSASIGAHRFSEWYLYMMAYDWCNCVCIPSWHFYMFCPLSWKTDLKLWSLYCRNNYLQRWYNAVYLFRWLSRHSALLRRACRDIWQFWQVVLVARPPSRKFCWELADDESGYAPGGAASFGHNAVELTFVCDERLCWKAIWNLRLWSFSTFRRYYPSVSGANMFMSVKGV